MRKYSSPYISRSRSAAKFPRQRSSLIYHESSVDRRFACTKEIRRDSLSRYRRTTEKSMLRSMSSQHHDQPLALAKCEISYKSRLYRMEFEYGIEHTTIGDFVGSIRQLLRCEQVVLRSGILTLDYLLTLHQQLFRRVSSCQLSFTAYDIRPLRTPANSLKQFNILKCIGSGGFSKVYLAETMGTYIALKIMDKERVIQNQKQSIILNEKAVLMKLREHPFVTKLHYTIETENTISFGLEFCVGGELFNLLRQHRRMKEDQARFYFLEVLSVLHEAHRCGIVYRDLKPENIVIDHEGHVRLADFGLSKFDFPDENNESFCGSAQYMAPEMLLRKGHRKELDVYCLGALLYELVVGIPPFYSKNMDEMFYGILNERLQFPSDAGLSDCLQDLLERMLIKSPEHRPNLDEVLLHSWCGGFSLKQINSKQLTPPFRPDLTKYNFDDSEFSGEEAQDLILVAREQQHGDLVLPLFRRFYFQSHEMSRIRQRFSEHTLKRSTSQIANEADLKRPSKLRLRTEQESTGDRRGSIFKKSLSGKLRSSSKGSTTDKKDSGCKLPVSTTNQFRKILQESSKNFMKCYRPPREKPESRSGNVRPIRKAFKGKDYLKELFAGRA